MINEFALIIGFFMSVLFLSVVAHIFKLKLNLLFLLQLLQLFFFFVNLKKSVILITQLTHTFALRIYYVEYITSLFFSVSVRWKLWCKLCDALKLKILCITNENSVYEASSFHQAYLLFLFLWIMFKSE